MGTDITMAGFQLKQDAAKKEQLKREKRGIITAGVTLFDASVRSPQNIERLSQQVFFALPVNRMDLLTGLTALYHTVSYVKHLIDFVVRHDPESLKVIVCRPGHFPGFVASHYEDCKGCYNHKRTVYVAFNDDIVDLLSVIIHELVHFSVHKMQLTQRLKEDFSFNDFKRDIIAYRKSHLNGIDPLKQWDIAWRRFNYKLVEMDYANDMIAEEMLCRTYEIFCLLPPSEAKKIINERLSSLQVLLAIFTPSIAAPIEQRPEEEVNHKRWFSFLPMPRKESERV